MDIRFDGHARHGWRAFARACIASLVLVAGAVHAGVVIEGTRVVYPTNEREVVVRMTNQRAHPVLVEAWIEHPAGAADPDAPVPFAMTPPLFRLDPGKGQSLRIFQLPGPVPTDREALYLLNVRDIPPKAADAGDDGQLSIAYRSRLKLFHRPANLSMQAKDAPQALRWNADGTSVRVHNPTPYFVTITEFEPQGGKAQPLSGVMVAPFADLAIALESGNTLRPAQPFHYTILNDLGGAVRLAGKANASP